MELNMRMKNRILVSKSPPPSILETHDNPDDALDKLREFSRLVAHDSSIFASQIMLMDSEIKNMISKLENVQTRELSSIKAKSTELQGEGNRLMKDRLPNVLFSIDRDFNRFHAEFDDFDKIKASYEKSVARQIGKLQKMQEKMDEIDLNEMTKYLEQLLRDVNKDRNSGQSLKKKIDRLVEESRSVSQLVIPTQTVYRNAKIMSYHDVIVRFQENCDRRVSETVDFKLKFNKALDDMMSKYQPCPDLAFLVPFFRQTIAINRTIKTRIQKCLDLMTKTEDHIHEIGDVIVDMMSPVVPKGKFSLKTLLKDWETFEINNEIVQEDAEKQMYSIWNRSENVMHRIAVCEAKMEWCQSRIRVWEADIRAQILYETSFTETLNRIENNINSVDELIEKKGGRRARTTKNQDKKKEAIHAKLEKIVAPPPYPQVHLVRFKVTMPKLPLTYPDTADVAKVEVRQTTLPRKPTIMPKKIKGMQDTMKVGILKSSSVSKALMAFSNNALGGDEPKPKIRPAASQVMKSKREPDTYDGINPTQSSNHLPRHNHQGQVNFTPKAKHSRRGSTGTVPEEEATNTHHHRHHHIPEEEEEDNEGDFAEYNSRRHHKRSTNPEIDADNGYDVPSRAQNHRKKSTNKEPKDSNRSTPHQKKRQKV